MAFWKKKPAASKISSESDQTRVRPAANPQLLAASGNPTPVGEKKFDADKLRDIARGAKEKAAALGAIVGLLMRSPQYKNYVLADLEWLVVPAVLAGQFSLAQAQSKSSGRTTTVGALLWARVSEDVNRRLNSEPAEAMRLKPQEWTSGDRLRVVLAIGNTRVVEAMVKGLTEKHRGDPNTP